MDTIRRYKWIILVALAVGSLALAASFLASRRSPTAASTEGQEVAVAFVGDLAQSATASGRISAAREAALSFAESGLVESVPVGVGDTVQQGELLMSLDAGALQRAVTAAEYDLLIAEAQLADLIADPSTEDLAAAEASVHSAQAKLDDLLAGPSSVEIAASEASVAAAQAAIWSASGNLSAVQEVSAADVAAAEKELDDAVEAQQAAHDAWVDLADCEVEADGTHSCTPKADNERMEAATEEVRRANAQVAIERAQLNELANPDRNQVASSQAGIGSATAQYDAAVARHAALLAGPSTADIAAAEAELSSARAALDALLSGPDQTEVSIAETRVAQARTALKEAQFALDDAILMAPFDGTVTAIHFSPGEQATGLAVEMIASDGFEVILDVDEVDIGKLAVGQTAMVTLESWPDEELSSQITTIAPRAESPGSGIVSYEVHLSLPETELPLLAGMTANADLITANREDVLLVPNAAVSADREAGTFTVNVVRLSPDGESETVPVEVTTGIRDSRFTQITSGLNPGDQVILGELTAPIQTFGGPPGRRGG